MLRPDWSRPEVELVVDDYLEMLACELSGVPYNKAARCRALLPVLNDRSRQSVEFKRANISAVLLDLQFPWIAGYKWRANYQELLAEVVGDRIARNKRLLDIAAADADRPMAVPEVADLLGVLTEAPHGLLVDTGVEERRHRVQRLPTNYLERESNNRSLGLAGEEFVLAFERERLCRAGRESLAGRIEHTSQVRGDHEGFDILSFDTDGAERLIEVKTTKYAKETPFFVSRNEVNVSTRHADRYHVYRMFEFRAKPKLYTITGAIPEICSILSVCFLAVPR